MPLPVRLLAMPAERSLVSQNSGGQLGDMVVIFDTAARLLQVGNHA